MRRLRVLVALSSLIFAMASASASLAEARVGVPHAQPFGAPQLAGGEVVHGVTNPDGSLQLRATDLATGAGRTVRPLGAVDKRAETVRVDVAADEGALASTFVQYAEGRGYTLVDSRIFQVGALDGPERTFPECRWASFAVTAGRIASTCESGRAIKVEDASTGDVIATVPVDAGPLEVIDIEGPLIAYAVGASPGTVVVFDYAEGRELYRVPGAYGDEDLDRDGTLVRSRSQMNSPCDAVEWFSVAEPTAHPVQVCGRHGALVVAAGRIATTARVAGIDTLLVLGLDGHVLKSLPNASASDFDGDRLAYRCSDRDGAWVESVGEPLAENPCTVPFGTCTGDPGPLRYGQWDFCPAAVRSQRVRLSRDGTAIVHVRCVVGCTGSLALRRGSVSAAREKAFTQPRGTAHIRVRIRGAKRIPRAGARVRAVVRTRGISGEVRRYEKTITLLPAKR